MPADWFSTLVSPFRGCIRLMMVSQRSRAGLGSVASCGADGPWPSALSDRLFKPRSLVAHRFLSPGVVALVLDQAGTAQAKGRRDLHTYFTTCVKRGILLLALSGRAESACPLLIFGHHMTESEK